MNAEAATAFALSEGFSDGEPLLSSDMVGMAVGVEAMEAQALRVSAITVIPIK
jgi:hypothetical protein